MLGKNKSKTQFHNAGMTMLETLAAFLILIIITLAFLSIIQFSGTMTMEAEDRRVMAEELNEKLAQKTEDIFTKIPVSDGYTCSLRMVLDTELTSTENYSGSTPTAITLNRCDVYEYAYPDETAPDVCILRFRYHEDSGH